MELKTNTYRVWIKGQKEAAIGTIDAVTAQYAAIAYASRMGVKSYQVEAVRA